MLRYFVAGFIFANVQGVKVFEFESKIKNETTISALSTQLASDWEFCYVQYQQGESQDVITQQQGFSNWTRFSVSQTSGSRLPTDISTCTITQHDAKHLSLNRNGGQILHSHGFLPQVYKQFEPAEISLCAIRQNKHLSFNKNDERIRNHPQIYDQLDSKTNVPVSKLPADISTCTITQHDAKHLSLNRNDRQIVLSNGFLPQVYKQFEPAEVALCAIRKNKHVSLNKNNEQIGNHSQIYEQLDSKTNVPVSNFAANSSWTNRYGSDYANVGGSGKDKVRLSNSINKCYCFNEEVAFAPVILSYLVGAEKQHFRLHAVSFCQRIQNQTEQSKSVHAVVKNTKAISETKYQLMDDRVECFLNEEHNQSSSNNIHAKLEIAEYNKSVAFHEKIPSFNLPSFLPFDANATECILN